MISHDDPSDPEHESTRKIVLRLRDEAKRREGASTVWRALAGVAATVAIGLAGYALTLATQASADHENVARHERQLDTLTEQLSEIRAELAAQTALMQRVERQLDDRAVERSER